MTLIDEFKAARRASTPLIAITTPDPAATMEAIMRSYPVKDAPPFCRWDEINGIYGVNDIGKKGASEANAGFGSSPALCLSSASLLPGMTSDNPRGTVLFAINLHSHLGDTDVRQAVWNLRDIYKADRRALVVLCPSLTLPSELANDFLILDEAMPTAKELERLAVKLAVGGKVSPDKVSDEALPNIVSAILGLPAFPAEQSLSMCLTEEGYNIPQLWKRKRQAINAAPGMTVFEGEADFASLGGLDNLKGFMGKMINGTTRPRIIVFIDEIEKSLAGFGGDNTGVTEDQVGSMLKFMQDNKTDGMLLYGPAGTGKSQITKAMGNEGGIPVIELDLGGMKAKGLGDSEANIRQALKVIKAMGQDRITFVATCNSMGVLPPELRRRFKSGTFFMDLPNEEERLAIWKFYAKKYPSGEGKPKRSIPYSVDWTGAEIETCCDYASRFGCTLNEAAEYIVPVARSAAETVQGLRRQASGRFISASERGLYIYKELATTTTNGTLPTGERATAKGD